MKKIAILGNCQSVPLAGLLSALCPNVKFVALTPVHRIDVDEVAKFLSSLDSFDAVITQPISAGYRNNIGVDTDNLRSRMRPDQQLVLIPNLHFEGFFPTWGYMKYKDGRLRGKVELKNEPDDAHRDIINTLQRSDYQCFLILCAWFEGLTVNQTAALLETPFNSEFVRSWYADSLAEFIDREQVCHIHMASVLQSITEYSEYRFYSFNHPNKALLTLLALQVLGFLQDVHKQTDDANILASRILRLADRLDHVRLPIYPFVFSSLGMKNGSAVLKIYDSYFSIFELVENYYLYFKCLGKDGLAVNVNHQKFKLSQKLIAASSQLS